MSTGQGFIDLRLNHQRDQSPESFWPSFTDIMTVVVMIFMLAMLILLVRNMELVQELRATAEAERAAADLARAKDAERAKLAQGLTAAQASLRRVSSQLDAAAAAAREKDRQLEQQREHLEQALHQSQARYAESQSALDTASAARQEQSAALDQLRAVHKATEQDLARARADYEAKAAELSSALDKLAAADRSRADLAETYDELKARYNRLVRPARSSQGRHLVEVRYSKNGVRGEIQVRDGGEGSFHTIDRSTLDKRLSELTKAHPEGLYVKVIFPKDSGLSFSEAWQFTNALHNAYDYYYRDQGPADQRTGKPQ